MNTMYAVVGLFSLVIVLNYWVHQSQIQSLQKQVDQLRREPESV